MRQTFADLAKVRRDRKSPLRGAFEVVPLGGDENVLALNEVTK